MPVAAHRITFTDKRKPFRLLQKLAVCNNPVEAKQALGPQYGGTDNLEILEFDGEPCEDPILESSGSARVTAVAPELPPRETIEHAAHRELQTMIQHFREVRQHKDYFDHVSLNRTTEVLRKQIMDRLYPQGEPPTKPQN